MATLYKYRVYCQTEAKYVKIWLDASDPEPTTCPTDPDHTVTLPAVVVETKTDDEVIVKPNTDGLKTLMHGAACSFGASAWGVANVAMPVDCHIQEVKIRWAGCFLGDYGFLAILHPLGDTSPAQAVSVDDTDITLPSAEVAAVYAAAFAMEFWSDDGTTLVERRQVESVNGAVVTLVEGVSNAHSTSAKLKAALDTYSPCLGGDNCGAGFQIFGDGADVIRSENEFTQAIPANCIVSARFKGTADAGTREITVNYRFRQAAS